MAQTDGDSEEDTMVSAMLGLFFYRYYIDNYVPLC